MSEGNLKQKMRLLFRLVLLLAGTYWATLDPIDMFLTASWNHVEAPADLDDQDVHRSDGHHHLLRAASSTSFPRTRTGSLASSKEDSLSALM